MYSKEALKQKKILVVAAHPDDELLGLGATMNKWVHEFGVKTHVLILGEGITSRSEKRDPDAWKKELAIHRQNIDDAAKIIGYHKVTTHDFPDNRFDTVALLDIIKVVEKVKSEFQPDIIFTHHGGDLNIDHQRTYQAVLTACRPLENETVSTIITFETPSSTEWTPAQTQMIPFQPNLFIEITENHLQAKIDAMEAYRFEKREHPHPRSPGALKIQAQQHGITTGCTYAEAFSIVRHISKY